MTPIDLQPLLPKKTIPKDPINPNEFWPAFPSIAQKTAELFGSQQERDKIPIFPIEDLSDKLQRKWCCLNKISIRQLDHPIEIYFLTNEKGASGITIAYRIQLLQKAKFSCLSTKIQTAIEMIDMVSPENPKNTSMIGRVFTAFGPASASDSRFLSYLQKLFMNGEYQEKRSALAECFSLYKPAQIKLI